MIYYDISKDILFNENATEDITESNTEDTTESTTELQVASNTDAWTSEKVDNIVSYTYGSFVLLFFIVIYLLHDMLHKILIRNTNEIR